MKEAKLRLEWQFQRGAVRMSRKGGVREGGHCSGWELKVNYRFHQGGLIFKEIQMEVEWRDEKRLNRRTASHHQLLRLPTFIHHIASICSEINNSCMPKYKNRTHTHLNCSVVPFPVVPVLQIV